MTRPSVVIFAGETLFESFFWGPGLRRLKKSYSVRRVGGRRLTAEGKRALAGAEAIITTWDSPFLGADVTTLAPRLRMIAHCGGELKRRFDVSLFERVTITNSAGPFAEPVAEFAATMLLYTARNVDAYRAAAQKNPKSLQTRLHATGRLPGNGPTAETLVGREVSMIGLGRIGRTLMEQLRGFHLRWLVYDPYAAPDSAPVENVEFHPLRTVLKRGKHLIVAAGATDETLRMLNAERLALLPDGATVINMARGSLIDLPALTREVRSGRLRCALDVTDPDEPLPLNHPLRKMPSAILTPHMAGGGVATRAAIAGVVMDDLDRFFSGQQVENRVTVAMLGRMT